MTLFAFATDRCREAAKRHGLLPDLERIAEDIERDQRATGFTPLCAHFTRKRMGKDFRLPSYEVNLGEHRVQVLADVLRQEGPDQGVYGKFLNARYDRPAAMTVLGGEVPTGRLRTWVEKRLRTDPPAPLPAPTNAEYDFLYSAFSSSGDADGYFTIYEAEPWVRQARVKTWQLRRASLCKLLERAVTDLPPTPDGPAVCWDDDLGVGVVYARDPATNAVLLIEPIQSAGHREDAVGRARREFPPADRPDFARAARRAYPAYYVMDLDSWAKIQEDPSANYALSAEEMRVLDGLRNRPAGADEPGQIHFPLFINGRAGSGKSLLLHYATSDLLGWALAQPDAGVRVLFTSCSEPLVGKAKDVVRRQLTHGHRHALNALDPDRVDAALDESFVVFHDFAESLLPAGERARFRPDRRIRYSAFKQKYATEYVRRGGGRHRIELVWHVIRLLVKGLTPDVRPDPTPYPDLPRWARQTVARDDYDAICKDVYKGWYRPLGEKGWWDDQDLLAYLLSGSPHPAVGRYAAVLCDESQDLTPIEFEFLLQLSAFSRRTVEPKDLPAVPFLFAGDPAQTLNPTGFSWSSVSAVFYEKYASAMAPGRDQTQPPQPTRRDLSFNYRSNQAIAKFCNTLQLLRLARLGTADLTPQEVWKLDPPVSVHWLDADAPETRTRLARLAEAVKIVDCEDGDEKEYVDGEDLLRGICTLDPEAELYRNVFSPARAKGLEYDTVILYKFGASAPPGASACPPPAGEGPSDRLKTGYFLNRLYVAASRAERQLVVVDTRAAFDQFWQFATDQGGTARLLDLCPEAERDRWATGLGYLLKSPAAWDGETITPREQGRQFREKAEADRDSFLMRQAGLAFRNDDETGPEAKECFALAEEYDGQFSKAAPYYDQLNRPADALRCWWAALDFPAVARFGAQPEWANDLRVRAADALTHPTPPDAFLALLSKQAAEPKWCRAAQADPTWNHVLGQVFHRLAEAKAAPSDPVTVDELARHVHEHVLPLPDRALGLFAFHRGDFRRAADHWEAADWTRAEPYYEAKARLEKWPACLVWWHRLRRYAQVCEQWLRSPPDPADLSHDQLWAAFESAKHVKGVAVAADIATRTGQATFLKDAFLLAVELQDAEAAGRVGEVAVAALVRAGEWQAGVDAARSGAPFDVPRHLKDGLTRLVAAGALGERLTAALVRELATSDELARAGAKRAAASDFLEALPAALPPSLPWQEVGAALERCGKHVAGVQFYERWAQTLPPDRRGHAAARWARCLERFAQYHADQGHRRDAGERQAQAAKLRQEYGVPAGPLPEYPDPADWRPKADPPADAEFEFKVSEKTRRIDLTHRPSEKQVRVTATPPGCKSDDLDVRADGGRWWVDDWGMCVTVHDAGAGQTRVRITWPRGEREYRV